MTGPRPVHEVADPVWALIAAIANVNTYDGELIDDQGQPVTPPLDDDGRVHAYAVYYPAAGLGRAITLDADPDVLDWTFQVTAVGGDRSRALWCVEQVRKTLTGVWITIGGQSLQIREDTAPAPLRRDDAVVPSRRYAPLTFVITGA